MSDSIADDDSTNSTTTDLSTLFAVATRHGVDQLCFTKDRAYEYVVEALAGGGAVHSLEELPADLAVDPTDVWVVINAGHAVKLNRDWETANACLQAVYNGDGGILPLQTARELTVPAESCRRPDWLYDYPAPAQD
jgi:hypothetical protein